MKLKLLEPHFTICKVADMGAVDWNAPFCFAARTDEECSLVCPDVYVPNDNLVRESGWRAVRIEGILDFGLTGILAGIAGLLADREIPIFAVSTYNTDYVLLKGRKTVFSAGNAAGKWIRNSINIMSKAHSAGTGF